MTRARHGYSLLELLVVLTLLGAAMTMITASLHGLYRGEARVRRDLEREHAVEQFLTRWRWDAHEATAAELLSDAAALTLSLADGRKVIYTTTSQGIERTIFSNNEVRQRETFRFDVQPTATWKVAKQSEAASSLTLHLELPGKRGSPSQSFDFTSALGMLHGVPPLASSEAR